MSKPESNSTFDTPLVGAQSTQQGAQTEDGKEKPKIRYSGAARRRFKKEREAKEAGEVPGKSGETEGKRAAKGKGVKRPSPEHNTPSPQQKQSEKRHRPNSGTYAQATSNVTKLAVVPSGYPDAKLTPEVIERLKNHLERLILNTPSGTKAPIFEGIWTRDGAVIFGCSDEPTESWLKGQITDYSTDSQPLHVIKASELPKRQRVVLHVERKIKVDDICRLLDIQNTGLDAGNWTIDRGSVKEDLNGTHFAALVSEKTLEVLKACNFRPHCGIVKATVKLLEKHRNGGEGDKEPPSKPQS